MRRIHLLVLFSFLVLPSHAQKKISGKSNVKKIEFKQTVNNEGVRFIPELEISNLLFNDDNSNGLLEAGENSYISFTITNLGKGEANDVVVMLEPKHKAIEGLVLNASTSIGIIYPGQSTQVFIPISSTPKLDDGTGVFLIRIIERNSFNPSQEPISIETSKFRSPEVIVADAIFSTKNGKPVEINSPIFLSVLIQNIGEGPADNIVAEFILPQTNCLALSQKIQNISALRKGESKEIKFSFVATQGYDTSNIPIKIALSEGYGEYATGRNVQVAFGQELMASHFSEKTQNENKKVTIASLSPEVDKNIPESEKKYPNRIALIIGNEDYTSKQQNQSDNEINVEFARNDARIFKEYTLRTLGVEEKNIFYLIDATSAEMQQNIELVSKLANRLGPDSEIIFYYAGHGLPDEVSRSPYLIPVDVSGQNLTLAIPIKEIYMKLGNSGAKKVTVFLDACFSGGGRNSGLIASRGIRVKPKEELLPGNIVSFSASSDQQTALPYNEKQHGMFTYFLLKGLQDAKGDWTYGELSNFLEQNIAIESLRTNKKEQSPSLNYSDSVADEWMEWIVK